MGDAISQWPPAGALLGVAAAALIGGLSRGFSGFGAALVFVPLAAAVVGPRQAVPVLALMECVACLFFLPGAWRLAEKREVALMAGVAMCAVPLGGWILAHADPVPLRWVLSALVLAAVGVLASGWRYRGRPNAAAVAGTGLVGGVMSGAAMLGGVAPAFYWLGRAHAPAVLRGNMNLYFAILTAIIAVVYSLQGLFGWRTAWFALAAAPSYGIGLWVGSHLFWLASERTFRLTAYILILAAAVLGMPLWDPLTGR